MAETPALPWLLNACEKAGKGTINNMDARAVLRAVREAERAAVEAERERCAKVAAEMPRGRLPNMANDQERALRNRIAAAIRARGKEQNPA